jgi:hypothetical protein
MLANEIEFAEVQYFFNAIVNDARITLALVSLYSRPDEDLFKQLIGQFGLSQNKDKGGFGLLMPNRF